MELKAVKYEVAEKVAVIKLNRPHRMNAWTGRMHTEYRWCLLQAEEDRQVGAIVVTGEGKGFCVGADSKALEGHVEKGGYDPGTPDLLAEPGFGTFSEFDTNFAYHFGLSKPVIAAINGPAAGVGLVLACYADIRFAVPGVKLTTAHGKLNLPAEFGLSWLLPRIIGLGHANDMLFTSRVVMTEEAEQLGLVNRLVEPDQLLMHSIDYAAMLVKTVSPGSLRQTKRQIYTDLHRGVGASVDESEVLVRQMMKERNYHEAVKAYMAKRPPEWHEDTNEDTNEEKGA